VAGRYNQPWHDNFAVKIDEEIREREITLGRHISKYQKSFPITRPSLMLKQKKWPEISD